MKKVLSAMCVATMFGAGAGLAAQSDSMAKDQMDKGMMKDGQMTVSGCVTAGKGMGQYMLTNAMMMGAPMAKDTMATKDKMKPEMSADHVMRSYELVGGTDLKAHVGHQIEVMGTMSKKDMDGMAKMEKMDKDKMKADKDMKAMKLNVKSFKMISATCS